MPIQDHLTAKQPELRLFISSTFIDLQPEREQLIKKIFPQIRALCRERGIDFTEIDLRWGVTEEESRTGKTIRICMEEIDRCRPYFIGIIGSRYGWIPGKLIEDQDPQLLKSHPWLRDFAVQERSITDIEFSYGAIEAKGNSAFIYEQIIRRDEKNEIPISLLRSRITSAGVPFDTFSTPEELGEKVLRDFSTILDRDFPANKEPTPAERERQPHEAFAHNRTHSYIADPEYFRIFSEFVESSFVNRQSSIVEEKDDGRKTNDNGRPLILWGKSGFGKSALMAHLTSEYRHHHPEAFIIRHFTGASAGASSADDVMRHIMLEIKEWYKLDDAIPTENLQNEISSWLAKIPEDEKLVLAIDAVNQLTGIGPEMHWLPEFIPANIRLIVSTTPETPLEELRKRNWQELEIKPLSSAQRKRITHEFLEHYHKHLDPELLEVIAKESKLQSPLFLRTILEELRVFGHHTALDKHLANYLSSKNEAALFQKVLDRMESDHGANVVRSIMSAIWASRYGLSETELLGITGFTRLVLSEFLIALEFHLMRRSGLFTFFHNYLREAVETRYIASGNDKQIAHSKLAEYFSSQEYSERRSSEEPYQRIHTGNKDKLLEMFSDASLFSFLGAPERQYELLGYWNAPGTIDQMNRVYSEMYYKAKKDLSLKEQTVLFTQLGSFLILVSQLDLAQEILSDAVVISEKINGVNALETAYILNDLATVYLHKSKNSDAINIYNKIIDIFKMTNDLKGLSEAQNNLAVVYYKLAQSEKAIALQRSSLELAIKIFGNVHSIVADRMNNLASILIQQGLNAEARKKLEEAITIGSKVEGNRSPKTIQYEKNLGILLIEIGEYGKALSIFRNAYDRLVKSIGEKHSLVADIHNSMSGALRHLSRFDEALIECRKAIEINRSLFGEDHSEVIICSLRYARINFEIGNNDISLETLQKYFSKLIQIKGLMHPLTLSAAQLYYNVLVILDRREEIETLLAQFPSLQ